MTLVTDPLIVLGAGFIFRIFRVRCHTAVNSWGFYNEDRNLYREKFPEFIYALEVPGRA